MTDRSTEPQAEPCPMHTIACTFDVSVRVQEGTTPQHLIEYLTAHLENRDPDLHEDIFDELEGLAMQVTGYPVGNGSEAMEHMLDAAESPTKAVQP